MTKNKYILIIGAIILVIILAILLPITINVYLDWSCTNEIRKIKDDFLNNEILYDDLVDAIKELNFVDKYYYIYFEANNIFFISENNGTVEATDEEITNIKTKYLSLKKLPDKISIFEPKDNIKFIYISRNAIDSYMAIYLIYYDVMPTGADCDFEILSDHWALKIVGLV